MTRGRIGRADPVFLAVLAAAALVRVYLAVSAGYVHDEINTAIPLSQTIAFSPGHLHLPLRGENHGALPAYVVHASSVLFGTSPVAYRTLHMVLSLITVGFVYLLARDAFGVGAARWAAALAAFNDFYLGVSARATAHVPHLFLATAAILAFARFMSSGRPLFAYLAGTALGLAFYCKEHSALLAPLFLLTLIATRQWPRLKSPHLYLAFALFLAILSPDLLWNARTDPDTARVSYGGNPVAQATYGSHLQRIGGLGFSPYPLMFYGRSAVTRAYRSGTGRTLTDETPEYDAINPLLGGVMLAGVVAVTVGRAGRARLEDRHPSVTPTFLALTFWCIFGFFTLIEKGNPPGRMDPVSWIWVEVTLIPAAVLAGAFLASVGGAWRVLQGAAVAALVYAAAPLLAGSWRDVLGAVERTRDVLGHGVNVTLETLVDVVRSSPLRALAVTMVLAAAGGFAAGWLARARWRRPLR